MESILNWFNSNPEFAYYLFASGIAFFSWLMIPEKKKPYPVMLFYGNYEKEVKWKR